MILKSTQPLVFRTDLLRRKLLERGTVEGITLWVINTHLVPELGSLKLYKYSEKRACYPKMVTTNK